MNCVGEQISVATGTDQCRAGAIRKEAPQNDRKNEQAIVPERANKIFRARFSDDAGAIIDFVTQCPAQNSQKIKTKRNKPSRGPAFDLQGFFLPAPRRGVSSAQRYVRALGRPI